MRYARTWTIAAALAAGLGCAAPALAQGVGAGASGEVIAPAREPADAEDLAARAGAQVVTQDGKKVGVLARVLAGDNGHAAAIIEMGERASRHKAGVVVPAERLRIEDDKIVLEMSAEELRDLPGYEQAL